MGYLQRVEEMFLAIAHAGFHPPLLVCLALVAGNDGEAGMAGEIQVMGVEQRRLSGQAPQHRRLQIVHHELRRHPMAKKGKGVLMTGEELLHGLGEGELYIQQSTMTKSESLRRVSPTATVPEWPPSTWAHSPGANDRVSKAGARRGRTVRTSSCTRV